MAPSKESGDFALLLTSPVQEASSKMGSNFLGYLLVAADTPCQEAAALAMAAHIVAS